MNGFLGITLSELGSVGCLAVIGGERVSFENDVILLNASPDSQRAVVREGDRLPSLSDEVTLDEFLFISVNDVGRFAFTAELVGPNVNSTNDRAIYAENALGEIVLVIREGQQLEVAPGDERTVAVFNWSSPYFLAESFESNAWNIHGQLAVEIGFTDGTSGAFIFNVPESSSVALALTGLALIAALRARRLKTKRAAENTPGGSY